MTTVFLGAIRFQWTSLSEVEPAVWEWHKEATENGFYLKTRYGPFLPEDSVWAPFDRWLSPFRPGVVCFSLNVSPLLEGIDGWISDITLVEKSFMMRSEYPERFWEHVGGLPRPLYRNSVEDLSEWTTSVPATEALQLRQQVSDYLEGYGQLRFARFLRKLWHNTGVEEGVFSLGESVSLNPIQCSLEEMLKDIWMHYCFGELDDDTLYKVSKQ